jgi:hypothetical protein
MSPELEGFAAAVAQIMDESVAGLRAEAALALAQVRDEALEVQRSLEQRCERAEARADQLQRDLEATRELAAQAPISTMLVDGAGDLHVVQRGGVTTTVTLAQLLVRVASEVSSSLGALGANLRDEICSRVALEVQRMGGAQRWSRTAFYGEGAVVSCYNGRTYELQAGTRASIAQEPGDHPEVWRRIGSHGLRVMKSKPATLEPGDVFTEAESRFISDGENTILFSPRAPKHSDIERGVKPAYALAQSAMAVATLARQLAEGHAPRLESVERTAANAQSWIAAEGDEAVVRSAQALACVESRLPLIDSPALARILELADEINTLLGHEPADDAQDDDPQEDRA